jgi:LAS superfamily LD-carboxypeptidase LdcB
MRNIQLNFLAAITFALAVSMVSIEIARADTPGEKSNEPRTQAQGKANSQIEKQKQNAKQQAEQSIDKDATAAIQETQKAIKAINEGRTDEALAAIERATGKVDVLVARNPASALIPVAVDVEVIDTAPMDVKAIKLLGKQAERMVADRDYPTARVILQSLISEIRVRTYNIPLATYPVAMTDAARLLDQKKAEDSKRVLQIALNTLAVIDHVSPLPIATAQVAITDAQANANQDKEAAKRLLAIARSELDRAKELGYAGNDPEYVALNDSISNVEKQINGGKDSGGAFARLKEQIASFFHRQSQSEKKAEVASR